MICEKTKKLFSVVSVALCFCGACHMQESASLSWNPKVDLLQSAEARHSEIDGITKDVEAFYTDLHNKKWESTYSYRNSSFQSLVSLQVYLDNVTNSQSWELLNYQILSVKTQIDGDNTSVVLICKFDEDPMHIETYNVVVWQKEYGKWRCDAAGPSGLSLFSKMTE